MRVITIFLAYLTICIDEKTEGQKGKVLPGQLNAKSVSCILRDWDPVGHPSSEENDSYLSSPPLLHF